MTCDHSELALREAMEKAPLDFQSTAGPSRDGLIQILLVHRPCGTIVASGWLEAHGITVQL